ncbi:MAG: response regulator transcription factor [Acidobacteriota bacterium]
MITVFLADDHQLFREGLRHLLQKHGGYQVVGEAETSTDAIRMILSLKPEIALVDLDMPGVGGLEAARLIHSRLSSVKILIVSGQSEEHFAVRCLKAGASGFLHKRSAAKELVQALETIRKGGKYVSPDAATHLVLSATGGGEGPAHAKLSDREMDVMLRVAKGQSSSDIASALNLSVKTVSTYRRRISDKLDLHSAADIVRYALTNGLID